MLEATRALVFERGVSACTIEDVANRSGVAKTTIYRHYGGLDELIFAAVSQDVSYTAAPDTGSLRGDLIEIQRHYVEVARSPTARELFVWMVARAVADPAHAELFHRVRVQPRGPTTIALQRAISRGELDPTIDLDLAMHIIQGPFISKRIVDNSDISQEELEAMVDMAIRALTGWTPQKPVPPVDTRDRRS
jgi:AcrR family transcriptional regulator